MNKSKTLNLTAFLLIAFCLAPTHLYALDNSPRNLQNGFTGGDLISTIEKKIVFGFSDAAPDLRARPQDEHSGFTASYEFGGQSQKSALNFAYTKTTYDKGLDLAAAPDGTFKHGHESAFNFQAVQHFLLKNFTFTPVAGFTFAFMHEGKLNEDGQTSSFKPMLGFTLAHQVALQGGLRLTPEVYGIYRYELLDDFSDSARDRLNNVKASPLSRHGVEMGAALGFNVSDTLSGRLQFDSNMQPRDPEFRALFKFSASF